MSLVQIIFTFRNYDQEISEVNIPNGLDDYGFLFRVFDTFENKELKKLSDLVKMSCCQMLGKDDKLFQYLKDRNGKYYFNDETNEDEDTKKLKSYLVNYLKERKKK